MLDEPYRWLEAVNNRRDYIEDQLRGGSPVVGLKYDDGLLLVTIDADSVKSLRCTTGLPSQLSVIVLMLNGCA